jgi:hypothetical protein
LVSRVGEFGVEGRRIDGFLLKNILYGAPIKRVQSDPLFQRGFFFAEACFTAEVSTDAFSRNSESLCFNRCFGNFVSPDHGFYKSFSITIFASLPENLCFNWCFGNSVSPDYGFCKSFSITVLASPPQNLCFNTCFGNSISPKHCFYKSFNCMLLNSFLKNLCFIQ